MDTTVPSREMSLPIPDLSNGTAIEFIDDELPNKTTMATTALIGDSKMATSEFLSDQESDSSCSFVSKLRHLLSIRQIFSLVAAILASALVFKGIAVLNEDRPTFLLPKEITKTQVQVDNKSESCSPSLIDPVQVTYRSKHAFYIMLQSGLIDLPAPVFQGKATKLCAGNPNYNRGWEYCLPITGRKDVPYCQTSGRSDLLNPQTNETRCFASVLHMQLVDIYDEMKLLGVHPAVLYGTLLGAVREGRTIPFTEDVDIGYQMNDRSAKKLRANLAEKGYHMFHQGIWRVCVAPTHPLASNLYDPDMHIINGAVEAPYVDLYEMKVVNEKTWRVAEAVSPPFLPNDRIVPFSQVTLHGMEYDTVADPIFFLKREYGNDFMTPKPRKSGR